MIFQTLLGRIAGSSSCANHPSRKWRKMGPFFVVWFTCLAGLVTMCESELYDSEGPQFTQEPSRYNYFTNVQGLILQCSVKGSPPPQVTWISQKDGQPVHSYPGLRQVYSNGTMYFPPFAVSFYRPDVHDQMYICVATNPVGKIRSRDIHVRAVINQRYEVRLDDAFTSEGNDAQLRCAIPDTVKDFVSVTSWIRDASFNIFPHSGGGGRYFMVPSGELLIEDVSRNDSGSTFRCRTVNRLTGETQLSENAARLQLTGGPTNKAESPPHIHSRVPKLNLREGEVAVLLCLSEGHPPPSHGWLRGNGYGMLEPLRQTERIRLRKSAVIIENVGVQDAGIYVCYANNSLGSDRLQIDVIVTSPLSVQVLPPVLTVDIGKSGELTCWTNSPTDVTSSGMTTSSARQITWKKDGTEVRGSLRLSLSASGDKLRITTVQREDKGIYQCFVKSDTDMAQASAELRLGDAHPQLVYRFIEQTLRPGPAVSLKCSATGNPTPQITWLLDGFPLPHSERLLIGQYVTMNGDVVSHVNITSTRVEDGGEFKCVASNKLGAAAHSARLNIYGPPFVRNMPTSVTAVAGKVLTIKCPVAGYPIATISWEKDNQGLPLTRRQVVSPDGTLTIRDVDRTVDSGWYTCTATNKQGNSDRKGVQVNVVVPPKIDPFSFPESTIEGGRIFVACFVSEGDGPLRIKWFKNLHNMIPPGSDKMPRSEMSTHQIGDLGALALQTDHVKSDDSGNYSCVAKNAGGEVSYTSELVVHVPPRIAPFNFPAELSQGARLTSLCSVDRGDIEQTNLTTTWLKDAIAIQPGTTDERNSTRVVQVDAYTAMIIIEKVDATHTGNYTCRISNSVEEVSATASFIVIVPPRWVVEPRETEVTEGSHVAIPCQADGFPVASISWKKAVGNRPENYRDIVIHTSAMKMMGDDSISFPNGTLFIRSARKMHQGFYLCEATNGIGSGLSKVIRLVVNVPVQVKDPTQNVTVRVGSSGVLRCEILGDLPIVDVIWRKGMTDINSDQDFRYQVRTMNNSQGIFSELTVNNVGRDDTGRYICAAANRHGRSQAALWLYVQEPPDTPRNLHVISKGSRFVRLGWILTQDGNSPIIQFTIQYHEQTTGGRLSNNNQELVVLGHVFSETVGNLKPATAYIFHVVAENHVGQSERSEHLEVTTDGEAPEGRPKNVRVSAASSVDIQVTWEHPDKATWHGQLLGYYVGFKRYKEDEQYQFSTVDGKDSKFSHVVKGLSPFTPYEIVVQAYNSIGAGPLAEPLLVTTLEDVPLSAPDGSHCSPLTSQNLQVTWTALSVEQARGLVRGYKIFLERIDFDQWGAEVLPILRTTTATNIVINGLAKYANYSVQIQAFTNAGDGPLCAPIYCHTDEDVPGSPAAVKAVVSGTSSIIVSWLPPTDPNGQLTKYSVFMSGTDSKSQKKRSVSSETSRLQFDGLRAEEKYEFRVTASTRVGEGQAAVTYRSQTKHVVASIISFGVEHRVLWKTNVKLPCDTVGISTVQWSRYSEVVRDTERFSSNQNGSLIIRDARRDDSGNYTCTVSVKNGFSAESIQYRLVVQVPPLAPILSTSATTHGSITLQWKLVDSGGAPIRGYILHVKSSDGEWTERRIARHLTTFELRDLDCGTRHQVYLTASNRAGMGRASDIMNASTLGGVPSLAVSAPNLMVQTNRTWARVLLKNVWSPNGCPIHKYRVLYKDHGDNRWQAVAGELHGESPSVDLVGLKSATSYQLRVVASNSAGSTQAEVTITTPSSSQSFGAETSNNIMNQPISTPFYLDIKLMGPILLSCTAILVAAGGICLCYKRKTTTDGRSNELLSIGTPSSSTYFKQNQRNSQQIYMTVKKSTPIKSVDMGDLDHIPQYADDIYPYATFELNEPRRDSRSNTTLDRRRCGVPVQSRNMMTSEKSISSSKQQRLSRHVHKADESEEYDSIGSDSDATDKEMSCQNKYVIRNNIGPSRSQPTYKFADYETHLRCGNRYEFVPPCNPMLKFPEKLRPFATNELHLIPDSATSSEVSPAKDIRPRRDKKTKHKVLNFFSVHPFGIPGVGMHIEPPVGFSDASTENEKCTTPQSEFAIAV